MLLPSGCDFLTERLRNRRTTRGTLRRVETSAPLDGLRVLETACGIAGPYAGRLLAMAGATVVKVEPRGGDPARRTQVDEAPLEGLSPLFVHLNAAKLNCPASEVDPDWADVIIASDPGAVAERARQPSAHAAKLVTVTPWGADLRYLPPQQRDAGGPVCDPDDIHQELLVQTATGFLGFNGDEGAEPLRLPGWQAQYVAGGLAAAAAHLILRSDAAHVDVSWFGALLTALEICYGDALHCQRPRPLVGAHPPTAYPSGAIACADGFITPGSIRPVDWEMECLFWGIPEWIDDPDYAHRHRRAQRVDEIAKRVLPWFAARTKRELFQLALDTPWAAGMVMTPLDAQSDEHLEARGFLAEVTLPDGQTATAPVRPFVATGLPVARQQVRAQGADRFPRGEELASSGERLRRRPLCELKIIEMTISWAGPYVGNLLAPLGVDVIKIEAQSPFDGFRTQRPYDHGMAPGLEGLVTDNRFYEAGGLFNAVNKGKRGCVMSLADSEGREAFGELVRHCDGLVANFSAHVLPQLGLTFDWLSERNERFVVVRMPAFGTFGPYAGAVGYGSIIEAMGGLAHRQGYLTEGARVSNIYFPDPLAGICALNALLCGIEHADRTGHGIEIDVSQQEAAWLHSGEALVLASLAGRAIGRMGNDEPGETSAGFIADGERWAAQVRWPDGRVATQTCLDPWTAPDVAPLADALDVVDHPVTGPMRHLASPFIFDGVRPTPAGPSPLFDQHTDEVLSQVGGLSAARIAALRAAAHVGGELPPPAELGFVYD